MKTAEDDFWGAESEAGAPDGEALGTERVQRNFSTVLAHIQSHIGLQGNYNVSLLHLIHALLSELMAAGVIDLERFLAELSACRDRRQRLRGVDDLLEFLEEWLPEDQAREKQATPPSWTPEVIAGDGTADGTREDGPAKDSERKRPALRSVTDKPNRGKKGDQA